MNKAEFINENKNEFEYGNDCVYFLKTTINQKNEDIKSLMHENKTLRSKMNDRPHKAEVKEYERKIDELEKIVDLLKYELETLRIAQDTNRMEEILSKTQTMNKIDGINSTYNLDKKFLVKSHITRECMRRDKVIRGLKEISYNEYPSYEGMKRLFKLLSEVFKTIHIGDMIEKAEL